MKYTVFALIALSAGMSATVYASVPTEPLQPPFKFECKFESPGLGKEPGVTCHAEGMMCPVVRGDATPASMPEGCLIPVTDRGHGSEMKIHCDDGVRLFDRYPQFASRHDDLTLLAKDDGTRAFLTIFDIERITPTDHRRHNKFNAELITVMDEEVDRLEGACRIHFEHPQAPPPPPAPPVS